MSTKKTLVWCGLVGLVIALPFTIAHLLAKPDDAPITPLQHVTAAVANFFGPWGVAIVRLVDFPNAGLRSFSWPLALGLTVLGAFLVVLCAWVKDRRLQCLAIGGWALFSIVWLTVGFGQIADGLL